MTPITSGTSPERIIRSLLLSVLVDVFAVLYLWDGYVGYQHKNAVQLAELLGLTAAQAPTTLTELSADRGRRLADSVRAGQTLDQISADAGAPTVRQPDAAYFLGPGGWLKIELERDRVRQAAWTDASHTESDLRLQKWIGFVLAVVGFVATVNLARVIATRARLSADGLQINGRSLIPFEAMTALRFQNFRPGRVCELDYTVNGKPGTLRLDPYYYRNAAVISQAIAQRKGFAAPSTVD